MMVSGSTATLESTKETKKNLPEYTRPLPERLREGLEHLSGLDMTDVQVHYNSSKPARVRAAAYAQGNEIYLGPESEIHLPHESWHVVQQKQGRVKAVSTVKSVKLNDSPELEKEARIMGDLAAAMAIALKEGYIKLGSEVSKR